MAGQQRKQVENEEQAKISGELRSEKGLCKAFACTCTGNQSINLHTHRRESAACLPHTACAACAGTRTDNLHSHRQKSTACLPHKASRARNRFGTVPTSRCFAAQPVRTEATRMGPHAHDPGHACGWQSHRAELASAAASPPCPVRLGHCCWRLLGGRVFWVRGHVNEVIIPSRSTTAVI